MGVVAAHESARGESTRQTRGGMMQAMKNAAHEVTNRTNPGRPNDGERER